MISITKTKNGWLATIRIDSKFNLERLHSTLDEARLWIRCTIDDLAAQRAA